MGVWISKNNFKSLTMFQVVSVLLMSNNCKFRVILITQTAHEKEGFRYALHQGQQENDRMANDTLPFLTIEANVLESFPVNFLFFFISLLKCLSSELLLKRCSSQNFLRIILTVRNKCFLFTDWILLLICCATSLTQLLYLLPDYAKCGKFLTRLTSNQQMDFSTFRKP